MLLQVWAIAATAAASVAAVFALRRRFRIKRWPRWKPSPNVNRYTVIMYYDGDERELYHGYNGLQARWAYENAPMEGGMTVQFFEWGICRGSKSA